jgi:hypothetical protein
MAETGFIDRGEDIIVVKVGTSQLYVDRPET